MPDGPRTSGRAAARSTKLLASRQTLSSSKQRLANYCKDNKECHMFNCQLACHKGDTFSPQGYNESAHSWPVSKLHGKLASCHKGSMGPRHDSGVQNRVSVNPSSEPPSKSGCDLQPGTGSGSRGGPYNAREGSHCRATQSRGREGFYTTLFLVPKKGGGSRPVINLKHLNEFIPFHHFKMEGMHTLKDVLRQND